MSEQSEKAAAGTKAIPIQCFYTQGMYPKLLKSPVRPQGLSFTNGMAVVTPEELDELKGSLPWKKGEIALRGQLPRGSAAAPVKVQVKNPNKTASPAKKRRS